MRGTVGITICACVMLLAVALTAAAADKKGKKLDQFWTSPEMAHIALRSVAMLPSASYDNDYKVEQEIETSWGPVARTTPFRWLFSTMSKELLRHAFGKDSILTVVRNSVLKDGRVDSLTAQSVCRALHTSALLTVRADQWDKIEMEFNQNGRPSTTVALKAALVDSTGRLLWTAAGSETGEGPMHNAGQTLGVDASGLGTKEVSGQGGAPAYGEVLGPLFARWITYFPGLPGAAPVTPAATPAAPGGH